MLNRFCAEKGQKQREAAGGAGGLTVCASALVLVVVLVLILVVLVLFVGLVPVVVLIVLRVLHSRQTSFPKAVHGYCFPNLWRYTCAGKNKRKISENTM